LNPVNGDIYVAAFPTSEAIILVYAAGSNGNVEPKAAIEGPDTGLGVAGLGEGIALDSSGTIYVASAETPGTVGAITVYPAGSNGNVTPLTTITGSTTELSLPEGIAVGQ
jgi:hypothetical protein